MRADFLDRHSRRRGLVHDRPAGLKLVIALALVATVVALPREAAWGHAAVAATLIAVAAISRVPPGFLVKRLLLVEPFVLAVAAAALFQPDGFIVFRSLVVRSTLSVATMILLAATTPFSHLLAVLRRLRCPALLLTTLALLYRYLFLIADEAERMRRARAARTFRRTGRRQEWISLATLAGRLFVRTSARAERVHAAMIARGWK